MKQLPVVDMDYAHYVVFKKLYTTTRHHSFLVKKENSFLIRKDLANDTMPLNIPEHPNIQTFVHQSGTKYYFELPPAKNIRYFYKDPVFIWQLISQLFQALMVLESHETRHGDVTIGNIRIKNKSVYLINTCELSCKRMLDDTTDVQQFGDLLQNMFIGEVVNKKPHNFPSRLWKLIIKCRANSHTFKELEPLFLNFLQSEKCHKLQIRLKTANSAAYPTSLDGLDIAKDFKRASMGNVDSMTKIGKIYLKDKRNSKCSIYWLKMASWHGCKDACLQLGKVYFNGPIEHRNLKLAEEQLRQCLPHVEAAELLAELELTKENGDLALASKLLEFPLKQRHPNALVLMGRIALLQNESNRAITCFKNASKLNNVQGSYHFALALLDGVLVDRNEEFAKELLRKNCDLKHSPSHLAMGGIYETQGAYYLAYKHYSASHLLHNSLATLEYARCQLNGIGCDKDEFLAIDTLEKIKDIEMRAYYEIGMIYGGLKDIKKSEEIFKSGAWKGCVKCKQHLEIPEISCVKTKGFNWRTKIKRVLVNIF